MLEEKTGEEIRHNGVIVLAGLQLKVKKLPEKLIYPAFPELTNGKFQPGQKVTFQLGEVTLVAKDKKTQKEIPILNQIHAIDVAPV